MNNDKTNAPSRPVDPETPGSQDISSGASPRARTSAFEKLAEFDRKRKLDRAARLAAPSIPAVQPVGVRTHISSQVSGPAALTDGSREDAPPAVGAREPPLRLNALQPNHDPGPGLARPIVTALISDRTVGAPAGVGERKELSDNDLPHEIDRSAAPMIPANQPQLAGGTSRARSKTTEVKYAATVEIWYRKGRTKRGALGPEDDVILSPMDVAEDLIDARVRAGEEGSISRSYWNNCRSALLWFFASQRSNPQGGPSFCRAYETLAATPQILRSERPARKRRKHGTIPERDLGALIEVLKNMNRTTGWGTRTKRWLLAGLASGLRPREWCHASWGDEEENILTLRNAKRKRTIATFRLVARGNSTIHDLEAANPQLIPPGTEFDGEKLTRSVPIDPADREDVDLHLRSLNEHLGSSISPEREAKYTTYYNMCRKVLQAACKSAFQGEKHYSLYNMRSQYAANLKAILPLEEVRQRMGHEPQSGTTTKSYGHRRAAHGGLGERTQPEKEARAEARRARAEQLARVKSRSDVPRG